MKSFELSEKASNRRHDDFQSQTVGLGFVQFGAIELYRLWETRSGEAGFSCLVVTVTDCLLPN